MQGQSRRQFWEVVIAAATAAAVAEGADQVPYLPDAPPSEAPLSVTTHNTGGVTFFVLNADTHISRLQSAQLLEAWQNVFRLQDIAPPILIVLTPGMRLSKCTVEREEGGPVQAHFHTEVLPDTDQIAKAVVAELRKNGNILHEADGLRTIID